MSRERMEFVRARTISLSEGVSGSPGREEGDWGEFLGGGDGGGEGADDDDSARLGSCCRCFPALARGSAAARVERCRPRSSTGSSSRSSSGAAAPLCGEPPPRLRPPRLPRRLLLPPPSPSSVSSSPPSKEEEKKVEFEAEADAEMRLRPEKPARGEGAEAKSEEDPPRLRSSGAAAAGGGSSSEVDFVADEANILLAPPLHLPAVASTAVRSSKDRDHSSGAPG